ncbi:hypothetical protein F5Y10DRAFT_271450 [Nemania abortiva]|nr:hypothetical protein F5Y10DRAFT_271450 [Nemania abortiva]
MTDRHPRRWTVDEDEVLIQQIEQQKIISQQTGRPWNWNSVAAFLRERSNKDCRKRWCKLKAKDPQQGQRAGPWAADEDQKLIDAVQAVDRKWTLVSERVGTRNPDQCAKRWQHCLDPSLDRSEWTQEEDTRLMTMVPQSSDKISWRDLAVLFPGRSTTNMKNRHIALTRRNVSQVASTSRSISLNGLICGVGEDWPLFYDQNLDDGRFEYSISDNATMSLGPTHLERPEHNIGFDLNSMDSVLTLSMPGPSSVETGHSVSKPSDPVDFGFYGILNQERNIDISTYRSDLSSEYTSPAMTSFAERSVNPCGSQDDPDYAIFGTQHTDLNTARSKADVELPDLNAGSVGLGAQGGEMVARASEATPKTILILEQPSQKTMSELMEILVRNMTKVTILMNR